LENRSFFTNKMTVKRSVLWLFNHLNKLLVQWNITSQFRMDRCGSSFCKV